MKNQKLIATAILVTLMGTSINAFANNNLKKYSPSDKESVIESLLNGKTLTSEQKSIKSEMIKEISERKTKEVEHKKIKIIEKKIENGETLSNKEKNILNNFKANEPKLLKNGPLLEDNLKHGHKLELPKHLYDKLSSEEKIKFNKMSDSEKKIFLNSKREEERKYRKMKEKVMYNLVVGIKLTSKQEEIRKEIKKEMDKKISNEKEHKKIEDIEEKVRNGKTLSNTEKNILKTFKSKRP